MAEVHKNTALELLKLSPVDKLDLADWLRQKAREELDRDEPGEGSTVAEATAALLAVRGLDKASRALVVNQIIKETAW